MSLHDFSFNDEDEPIIKFDVDISYLIFKASRKVEDFRIFFENFLEELKNLYDGKKNTAQFVPLNRELEIYFKQIENGHILSTLKLNYFEEIFFQSTLSLEYLIDQSFLPELIYEMEKALVGREEME